MNDPLAKKVESDLYHKLKWLMFYRVVFTTLLLGSTIVLQLNESPSPLAKPLLLLYAFTGVIFLLSFFYAFIFQFLKHEIFFAYTQLSIDTLLVTVIIFVTGGFSSILLFLYLVVIIYSSMLVFRKGSMIMAALCSIEYGIMVHLEYYTILEPFVFEGKLSASAYTAGQVCYKIITTMIGCFAVAFLSSLLSEQARRTKKELLAMENRMRRVEKMAAIGEMGAGLAHEIKNPIASLAGCIQLLREDIHCDPDHDRLMQIILREADRLNSLVSNFLLFARPPSGKIQAIELSRALSETIELFEKDGNCCKNIIINKKFASGSWVAMDPVHLHQIFWNLLLNAAESIEDKGFIDFKIYNSKNKHVNIEISDNGCGIPDEIMKSIFDPFFTTKPKGTGLGLSIVHNILESYESRFDIESKVNIGTTFKIQLKMIDPPVKSPRPSKSLYPTQPQLSLDSHL